VAGAAAVAVLVVALSRTRVWRWVLVGALGVLAVSETAHVVGTWTATTASFASKLGASVYSLGGVVLAVVALVWLLVRPPSNAIPAVLFAGLIVAVAGGLADLTTLTRSQLPTDAAAPLARTEVMLALGLGAGVAAAAALRLRPPAPPAERPSAKIEEPAPVS
jgi:4-amino-4-deoxy-L-arabinose transferase-like glycosyltransferase